MLSRVDFRSRLIATLRAAEEVLDVPGVLVVGSEVPNLLQPGAASTLVVSQDVDLAVPVSAHAAVKERLGTLRGLRPSPEEPSVWLPDTPELIELNFIGMDPRIEDPTSAYVLEDRDLPLMVFGALTFVRPGMIADIDGIRIPLPEPAGLILEKLLTDRSGVKGDRDLLVVAGMLAIAGKSDLEEVGSNAGSTATPREGWRAIAAARVLGGPLIASMQKRVDRIRERAALRRWEYRQRRYAHGVWFRLRRVLADAAEAYVIDAADVEQLLKSGRKAEPVGAELEPKRTLLFVEPAEVAKLPSAQRISVPLREIIGATNVALIRFG